MQDNTFIATQVRLPEVFLYNDTPGPDDHCLHEFHDLTRTAECPNDPHHRFIEELIIEFEAAAARGWIGFHYDSRGRRKNFRLSEL